MSNTSMLSRVYEKYKLTELSTKKKKDLEVI